ncbi:uncharacterized protein LOC128716763 [Anopheles marshallii]|uniref:uncharacterized protein LOC128716763 n=1 Tax=Anopheles marshallii TaxID=1521116 RepID=UPI00237B8D7E|nr:uncharacterized protein LOC128716763 [Anopheles marshallii]
MDVKEGGNSEEVIQRVQEVCTKAEIPSSARLVADTLEVKLLEVDPLAEASDVAKAVQSLTQERVPKSAVHLTEFWNGTLIAYVRVSTRAAEKLENQHVRVLHMSCVATKVPPLTRSKMRCYRCLEYGQKKDGCRSPEDRSAACFRCGQPGHVTRTCNAKICCAVCKGPHRVGHPSCPRRQ